MYIWSSIIYSTYYIHELDKTTQSKYDNSLCKQIEVIIIEEVDVSEVRSDIESIRKENKER